MAAAVDRRGGECRVSGLKALFPLPVGLSGGPVSAASVYDVSADGQRFLVNSSTQKRGLMPLSLVFNWTASLPRSPRRD